MNIKLQPYKYDSTSAPIYPLSSYIAHHRDTRINPQHGKFASKTLHTLGHICLTKSNCGLNIITLSDLAAQDTTPQSDLDKAVYCFMLRATQSKKHRFWLTLNAAGKRFQATWPRRVVIINEDFAEMYFFGDKSEYSSMVHSDLSNVNPFVPEEIAHELRI